MTVYYVRTHTGEEVVQPETSELRATGKWVYSFSVLVRWVKWGGLSMSLCVLA